MDEQDGIFKFQGDSIVDATDTISTEQVGTLAMTMLHSTCQLVSMMSDNDAFYDFVPIDWRMAAKVLGSLQERIEEKLHESGQYNCSCEDGVGGESYIRFVGMEPNIQN